MSPDPNVTCNEQATLLWDSCLRILLDEAIDFYSNPSDGSEPDTSYEKWYRAQLHLDKAGYEKRLSGIYELIPKKDEEENVEIEKMNKTNNGADDENALANERIEETHEKEEIKNRHKKRGTLSIGKIH